MTLWELEFVWGANSDLTHLPNHLFLSGEGLGVGVEEVTLGPERMPLPIPVLKQTWRELHKKTR